jgi:hypothetical protein
MRSAFLEISVMSTLNGLARPGKAALLTFVTQLLSEFVTPKARGDALRAEIAALKAQLELRERGAKCQAAPFSKGRRNHQPGRPGRKSGEGDFTFRTLPTADQWTAPPIEVRPPDIICTCCGEPLREARIEFAAVTEIPPQPKPSLQPYRGSP